MKPRILLLTGPQGSGNHVFSKCLALHREVQGWRDLLDDYWIRHEYEPNVKIWRDASAVRDMDWQSRQYHVISISCPFVDQGETVIPDYESVIKELRGVGAVTVALIGRDENILQHQELRLRGTHSYHQFLALQEYFEQFDPIYLSTELLYLYRSHYLRSLVRLLNMPIDYNHPRLNDILRQDPNRKYTHYVDNHWLDSNKRYFEREGYARQQLGPNT